MKPEKNNEINFTKEAVYKIVVDGVLNKNYSDRFEGMQVKVHREENKKPISVIIGEIRDQSALSGMLNYLYDLHFTVISVNMLIEKDQNDHPGK